MLGVKLESQSFFFFFFYFYSYAIVKDKNFKCWNMLKALIALV